MKPLATSLYCPNDCDKKVGPTCPDCKSRNTEEFDALGTLDFFCIDQTVKASTTYHCWPCGHVWSVETQKPETD